MQFLFETVWLIPVYSLVGSLLSLPWSLGLLRRTGPRPAAYISILMTIVALVHGTYILNMSWQRPAQQFVYHWLTAADLDISLSIELSPVSLGALELIGIISLLAEIFAIGYMEKDWSLGRFFGLLGFFEAALSALVLSDSLFLSYALLEMLTLSTYLLVGFWYAQPLVVSAARDAFLTKRVGDIVLFMGLVALSCYGEGLTFSQLKQWVATSPLPPLGATLLGLSLIAGPLGKCAQFPLNLWLDEAMEGPNPAGIMRNSVVVSAGAYVLIKLQPVFALSPIASTTLIVIGAITAIGSSLMAIAQIDIKRTLSHSTSAYLGLVFVAVGLGHVDIAFLILLSHAVAKALLFMSAGGVILTTSDQNITELGGLWSKMPATTMSFLVGSAGLVALLPGGIFWTFARWFNGDWAVSYPLLVFLGIFNALSALNLTRVYRLVFLGQPQSKSRRAPEVAWPMAVPMLSLIIVTIIFPLIPIRWSLWLSSVNPLQQSGSFLVQWGFPLIVLSGLLGFVVGMGITLDKSWSRPTAFYRRFFQDLFAYDFYLDKIYANTIVALVASIARMTTWLDRYVIDGAVNLVSLFTIFSGNALKYNASGQTQFYVLTIMIGVGLLIWSILKSQW
ncbi:MAG: NAD(P)H-quinone oxidoreductase subunit F [Cyanobacteriota bacterium ELA615]